MACVAVSGLHVASSKYQARSLKRSFSCSFDASEDALPREFHEMFRLPLERRKHDKKLKKKTPKERKKLKSKGADIQPWRSPFLEIRGNPSPFAVFTNVRQCILVKHLRDSARHFYWITAPQSTVLLHLLDSDSENEADSAVDNKDAVQTVPRIVGVGLCSVFELIRESRSAQPAFCLSVLRALLDILQGQQPEGFRSEPPEVIDKMFDLLLDIATSTPVQYRQPHSSSNEVLSQLTSNACACLLSLVVATGDTSKMLCAAAALLMSPRSLTAEEIPMPSILVALQKSVQAVLLGKVQRPSWLTHGIPRTAHCGTFSLHLLKSSHFAKHTLQSQCTIASDGKYLYLFRQGVLCKLGTGFGGTVKGELIASQQLDGTGWIGVVQDYIYIHHSLGRINEFLKVDKHTLRVEDVVTLEEDSGQSVYFSDGEFLGLITAMRDDGFVIRTFRPSALPMTCSVELNLKLARKCVEIFGSGVFHEEGEDRLLDLGCEEEPVFITSGKDFALVRTASGKILYTGKAQSLGIKQSGAPAGKWAELPITKCPRIGDCSVGHDGAHALLVSENGAAFFVGLARRGEDGDAGKGRRQPKPVKPKKMFKMESHSVMASACNNGTSALVTRSGELYLFGKDSSHADHSTGLVTDLKSVAVSHVALGKAHVVALTAEGRVYTFGINHRGQCGREFAYPSSKDGPVHPMALVVAGSANLAHASGSRSAGKAIHHAGVGGEEEDEELESEEQEIMCPPGRHRWKYDHCMVCTVCGECTGYGPSCIASGRPDRNPGMLCGCGLGDSGCEECGCCRTCACEEDYDAELAAWNRVAAPGADGVGAVGAAGGGGGPLLDNKQAKVIIFDMRYGGRVGARLEDKLRRSIEEYRFHYRRKQGVHSLKAAKGSSAGSPLNPFRCAGNSLGDAADAQDRAAGGLPIEDAVSSDHERETSKLTLLPPALLVLPGNSPAVQVACGMHHTVVLLQNGQVYTFGSNQHGQLGHGDLILRGSPTLVYKLPAVTQVAAGSNHSVFLTACGQVYTCGSYQKGQLGRGVPEEGGASGSSRRRSSSGDGQGLWHALPGAVPTIGVKRGRRATWVGASGDHTFVKLDEFLTSASSLAHCSLVANRSCLGIVSKDTEQASKFKCLMINRADGSCKGFNSVDQVDLKNHAVCLDSMYNVLWSLNQKTLELSWYSVVRSEAVPLQTSPDGLSEQAMQLPLFLGPELSLPGAAGHPVGRCQAALNLLGALDVLTSAQERDLSVREDAEQARHQSLARVYAREDFSTVNRFESHGGGWGYSGHSVEAIRFMADTDILLGGVGLFGGRGEYTARIRVFDIGVDGGDQETDGELLAETEEIPYECGARHKYPILFEEPILLQANRWYIVWAHISGPSSDCGSSGQSVVTTEDQVVFYFKSSKKSNNGTDVNAGQIPQLLYRVITPDVQTSSQPADQSESITILSHRFSKSVTPECFQSLLRLLHWGWKAFRAGLCELADSPSTLGRALVLDLRRLLYICAASLHLLRIYINEVYPVGPVAKKLPPESSRMAECVADTQSLLSCILSGGSSLPSDGEEEGLLREGAAMQTTLLEECEAAFMACYHTFYPSTMLKWRGLCELLVDPARRSQDCSDRLLAAVLASLCCPAAQLTYLLPPSLDRETRSNLEGPCSPESPSNGPQLPDAADSTVYPLLVEVVARKTMKEGYHPENCSFREVLERLLSIVVAPVQGILKHEAEKPSAKLVCSTCAFLSSVVAELSSQTIGCVVDVQRATRQALHCTPSRFTRVCQNRTWNTGNGSPDAICFSVDRPGVLIAGACIYGGIGNEWHYELELLDDSGISGDLPHTQRWKTVDVARGTFGPEDCYSDVAEVKFDQPIAIKENTSYAIRLRNHGARTNNGDGGMSQVRGPDGTMFTFTDCSLSFNGTNHTRGQIPQILYYSTPHDTESQQATRDLMELQARRNVLNICGTIVKASAQLLSEAASEQDDVIHEIGASHLMTQLLPLILAHLCPVASSDPQSAVEVLDLVQKLLKWVAILNQRSAPANPTETLAPLDGNIGPVHYAVVESDHPYKPATVSVSKVKFPPSVRWMALEFDVRCGTAQAEDSLQLYVPSYSGQGQSLCTARCDDDEDDSNSPFWPVLKRFCGSSDWPATATILPGNEVVFSLETASDYVKDNKANSYGFRCQVAGYEGVSPGSAGGLLHLEKELSYLGGMCAACLLRRDLILPTVLPSDMDEDMEVAEFLAHQVFSSHSALLSRGFALAHLPTIQQALEGSLSFSDRSNERPFLHDFVACTPGTSGGRLARWLQPECYVDPKQCELICSQEELKCGWPSVITVLARDQYAYLVHVPNMKVEVRAVPMNAYNQERVPCSTTAGSGDHAGLLTFGGRPPPSLDAPYEVTVKDKMLYYAITTMKQYEDYSFEELRYVSPTKKRLIENMLVRANDDGTYTANWTPGSVGWYLLHAIIDGFEIGSSQCRLVEVKEPPQGLVIPSKSLSQKSSHQPNKMRKFQAKYSAGLRIRSHPSLQSKQIGVVQVDGTVTFVDELHNDDGVWVRLSPETIKTYCQNGYSEAWCLQYNQHIGKTLLVPFEESKPVRDEFFSDKAGLSPKKKELKESKLQPPQMQHQQHQQQKQQQQMHPQQQHSHQLQQHQSQQPAQPPEVVKHGPGMYQVVRCGASGHNIRSKPNLKAPPVGMLVMGNTIIAMDEVCNSEGVWLRLDQESMQRHCFSTEGEAWTLARTGAHVMPEVLYLHHESEVMQSGDSDDDSAIACGHRCPKAAAASASMRSRGYNFCAPASVGADRAAPGNAGAMQGLFTFGSGTSDPEGGSSGSASPFVFGSPASTPSTSTNALADSEHTGPASERSEAPTSSGSVAGGSTQPASRRHTSADSSPPPPRAVPPELRGVSVRDLVRAIGESRANGNGVTPPGTPPVTPPVRRRRSSANSKPAMSSPVPIPGVMVPCSFSDSVLGVSENALGHSGSQIQAETTRSATPSQGSLSESGSFSKHAISSPRRASVQSESSVSSHLGSFFRELRDTSATGCIGCITQRTTDSPLSTPGTPKKESLSPTSSLKSFTQTGTQTSPEGGTTASMKGHFSIGSNSSREESPRISPKISRRERSSAGSTRHVLRGKRERIHSEHTERPAATEPFRQGLSPSVAECLRAVFCAFLWHEGVVHDAMACASYLKFNPDLRKSITKRTGPAAAPTKEQKARFRHSVEVTSPSLLQLQQLETLQSNEPLNENIKSKRAFAPATTSDQVTQEGSCVQEDGTVDLPRALRFLVLLWEQVTSVCKQAIKEQVVLPSLFSSNKTFQRLGQVFVRGSERRKTKKKRGYRSTVVNSQAAIGEKEVVCELCGQAFVPATPYQIRQPHPGCSDGAATKNFNGLLCNSWTGSCGDGTPSSSGSQLLCDRCREKLCQVGGGQRSSLGSRHRSGSISAATRVTPQDTIHHNMKSNAMFLLELSSSGMRSRRSGLPSLAEGETMLPSNQFAVAGPIQYFNMLGLSADALSSGEDLVPSEPGASSSQTAEADAESVAALNGNEAVEDNFAAERSDEAGLCPAVGAKTGGRVFHRSVSVGLTHLDWAEKDLAEIAIQEARALVVPRKRNNSSGSEGMSSILCQPSAALTKLVSVEPEACATDLTVQRPVIQFVLQRHDLESMRFAIQQSLRKATCRIYSMQAFNWLLRNVTQPTCLHDLLWCLVAAMSPATERLDEQTDGKEGMGHKKELSEQDKEAPCEHPLSDMSLAGEACLGPLRSAFHALLQTISDLMVFLPAGASLQQMAMQCWRLRFMPSDHAFLHRSHVFSNISRILSHSEEEAAAPSEMPAAADTSAPTDTEDGLSHQAESLTRIEVLRDLTPSVELRASSRQAMANSLCDNSTETFWESGDEDRNKTKVLTLICGPHMRPTIVCVHVDNCRDLANKVNSINFKFGANVDEVQKLKQVDVEGRFAGWLSCVLPDSSQVAASGSVWRLELRGPDNTLRLRQVKVLGHGPGSGAETQGDCRSLYIQQRNCEAETLRVFRLLTSQVFGKLLGGEAESPEEDVPVRPMGDEATSPERPETSNDLKEHMVGILFSRSKLTHLQKQVCSHIVAALRKEARRVREEWEASLCSPQPSPPQRTAAAMAGGSGASHAPVMGGGGGDTYCFEMLSMVLALSGSAVGRAHLSQQAGLLRDIFSLLHTGSARVQRQVTSLLRRVLPEVPPLTLASVLGVPSLPPSEYGLPPSSSPSPDSDCADGTVPLDIHRAGLLDVLLACVAKALTLQARSKGGRSQAATLATAIHPRDHLGARWWLRGTIARKLAQGIVLLLRDMAAGKLTEAWAKVTKGAIAENILNLTKMAEKYRTPAECLKTPTLWLALASLCVLDQEHVEKLSSGQWVKGRGDQAPPRPTCDNHDDGETPAIILCNVCGNVCADCDRFLHLHRRTKTHQRQVFKEEEEAIKVDLHEGCGRTKLFWVMALADSKTLKAMVEFRENTRGKSTSVPAAGICRFCGAPGAAGLLSAAATCTDCREHAVNACVKTHPCGHLCSGIRGETTCLPCLHGCGGAKGLRQDADDMCMICFSEALSCAPAIQLSCGHVFHYHCCKTVLSRSWSGPRITFGFSLCPICKAPMEHAVLKDLLEPIRALYEDVKRKALMRLEYEGLHQAEAITTPGARFYDNAAGFAMERYAYYVCYKCKKAYYGGEVRCDIEAGPADDYNPAELVCGGCSDISRAQMCPKHGTDFLEYKCRYCCSVAVFFCFGTTHFCNACHDDFQRVANLPKQQLPRCPAGPKAKQLEGEECPLHIKHPPTGEEFALGCGVCRNTHTF